MVKKNKKETTDNQSPELADRKIKIADQPKPVDNINRSAKPKNRFWFFLLKEIPQRTTLIIIGVAFLLALIIISANLYFSVFGSQLNSYYSYPDYQGPVYDTPSPLTGVLTTEKLARQKVVSAMIENHPSARPQSGLSKAGLVYEALVEGGITRFLAFFSETDAKEIGPVRSARSYYLPWVKEIDAFYAHVGGSPNALALIDQYNLKSLNQFYNSQYYWRESSRYSPHNVYTTSKDLRQAGLAKGWQGVNDFDSWSYQDETEIPEEPIAEIAINYSGGTYKAEYQYLRKENKYKRIMAGSPHKDLDGKQIKPTNLIVQISNQYLSSDGIRLNIETVGSGEAYIFFAGKLIKGQWRKDSIDDRTKFFRPNGSEVEFEPGSTWVHILSSANNLEYSR